MSNVSAKFTSVLCVGMVAGAVWTALPQHPVRAADSTCLKEPKDDAPQGKHWYYHIERGTGRHCWYMRDAIEKSASADTQSAVPAQQPAPDERDATTRRSIANAHAELAARARVPDDTNAAPAPSVFPNPAVAATTPANAASSPSTGAAATSASADTAASPLASRWPQSSDTAPSVSPPASAGPTDSASAPPETALMVADAQPTDANANATTDSSSQPVTPQQVAAAPAERNTGSLQKLMLVAFGALALAGLTGSAVYRLGRGRRRRNDWLRERTDWQSMEHPHDPPWVAEPQHLHTSQTAPDLDELVAAPASDYATPFEGEESDERVEKIEEFLARFSRQLQAELESTGRAERGARAAS